MGARASTLADAARVMAVLSDQLVNAVHNGDQDRIAWLIEAAKKLRPPHPFESLVVLAVCLAAQVDRGTRLDERLAWVNAHDPARLESVA